MTISVEEIGLDRERIPAWLVKIENNIGVIKYSIDDSSVQKVPLSELQLAPTAYETLPQSRCSSPENESVADTKNPKFNNREQVEVWMPSEVTSRVNALKTCGSQDSERPSNDLDVVGSLHDGETGKPFNCNNPSGAWWPGRILSIQNDLAHVEVAAPLSDEISSQAAVAAHVVRVGSTLPFRLSVVQLEHIRRPWPGRLISSVASSPQGGDQPPKEVASATLMTPGVLHRHAICIPAYLSRLATSSDTHAHLVKFCGAPCLVQCAPEPFLPSMFLKRVLTDGTGQAPKPATGAVTVSAANGKEATTLLSGGGGDAAKSPTSSPPVSAWSVATGLPQSTFSSLPVGQSVPGTLSSAGVTDPALLLEGLPGVNGPLVLLHIWSGSAEAIRRASILELAHVKLLVFQYHVLRKMSKGEPGELDLSESVETAVENGEARFLHCKPISIPVNPTTTTTDSDARRASGFGQQPAMMIGYSAQFRIQLRLVGLAIGHNGLTIQEARRLPGVRSVVLLNDGIIQVEAVSVEACQAVQSLLDYTEAEVPVSPRLASRLIGSKGENIRKLAASAGVRRAELLGPRERLRRRQQAAREEDGTEKDSGAAAGKGEEDGEEPPPPAFYLLGTRPAVAKMRLLLEFQADNWNELDELEETRRTLFSQLRQSNQPTSRVDSSSRVSDHHRPVNGMGPVGAGYGRGRWTDAQHAPNQGGPGRFRGNRNSAVNGGGGRMQHQANNRYRGQSSGSTEAEAAAAAHKTSNGVNSNHNNNSAAPADGGSHQRAPQPTGGRNRGRGGPRRRVPSSASQPNHNNQLQYHQPASTAVQ